MGADAIQDGELTALGVTLLRGSGSPLRGLLVPSGSLAAYRKLVREKLTPGYWNDIVERREVIFIFKLADGTVKELTPSGADRSEIAQLCSSLTQDPIEKTSDLPR